MYNFRMDYSSAQMEDQTLSGRVGWVDLIRVMGTFLVVLAHVENFGSGPQWAHALYYSLSRSGVPLFFMISGFLLLSKREDTLTYLKKRAWKILIPFLVWSIVYDIYWNGEIIGTGLSLRSVALLFVRIFRGPRATHLWFFYALIGLYLFTPVLRLFVEKARNLDLLYYIGIWFLAVPLLAILQEFTILRNGFELQFATGYVGYYLLGLYLGRLELTSKRLAYFGLMFSVGLISTFLVFSLDIPPQNNEAVFRSYLSANIILMSAAMMIFLKAYGSKLSSGFYRLLDPFSQASFGIYLIHPIVLVWFAQWLDAIGWQRTDGPSLVLIPVVAILGFLVTYLITLVLRKIPIVQTTVP
jgi:surface polysaccharide O-acyltransferase-like enzyme